VQVAAAQGVAVARVAPYRLAPSAEGGLIFGFSTITESTIRRGVDLLAEAVAGLKGWGKQG
jgi:GntR family transcriptional regulator / MocR family aminotransferase